MGKYVTRRLVKYVIRRQGRLYYQDAALNSGKWTKSIGLACRFTKGDALAYLASPDIPTDECEVVAGGSVRSDAQLERISDLPELRILWVCQRPTLTIDPELSDKGLLSLAKMTNLEELNICMRSLTDNGLEHLRGLTRLRRLRLYETHHTNVTNAGLEKLKQALPNCTIEH